MMGSDKFSGALADHMKVIWYNWMVVLVWILCFVISAFAAAVQGGNIDYGFFVIWNMLLLVVFAVGGTMVLRNIAYRTPLAVGFLIGSSFMMTQMMLQTAVISGSGAFAKGSGLSATAAFASLILIFLGSFTVFVTVWRDTLLPPPAMAGQDGAVIGDASGLPPPQFGGAGSYGAGYSEGAGYGAAGPDAAAGGAPPAAGGGVL